VIIFNIPENLSVRIRKKQTQQLYRNPKIVNRQERTKFDNGLISRVRVYGDPNWAASQATGKPDVLECGDNSKAWASKKDNSVEWIELTYPTPVLPLEINIYQNFNPSQVVEVMLISPDGKRNIAWDGYPERVKNCPDLMTIAVENGRNIPANKIRITVDQQVNGWGWNEIDAVELVGKPVLK
jgi:hypothetical protein